MKIVESLILKNENPEMFLVVQINGLGRFIIAILY